MGHTWREMDPGGAARHDARIHRFLRLRKRIEGMPLGRFPVRYLPILISLYTRGSDTSPLDMDELEAYLDGLETARRNRIGGVLILATFALLFLVSFFGDQLTGWAAVLAFLGALLGMLTIPFLPGSRVRSNPGVPSKGEGGER